MSMEEGPPESDQARNTSQPTTQTAKSVAKYQIYNYLQDMGRNGAQIDPYPQDGAGKTSFLQEFAKQQQAPPRPPNTHTNQPSRLFGMQDAPLPPAVVFCIVALKLDETRKSM